MSYSAMRSDGVAYQPAAYASETDRITFLRNVYLLMFSGILVYALTAALPVLGAAWNIPVLKEIFAAAIFVGTNPVAALVVLFGMIGVQILASSVAMVRGLNLIAFYGVAVLFGFISIMLFAYAIALTGGVAVIFQALGLTVLVFGGLSAYVLLLRKDFGFLGNMLFVGTLLLLGTVLIAVVAGMMGYPVDGISLALSFFSTLLISGYILYDTSNILHRYSTDMVVPAALALLIDFIILFRNLLHILAVLKGRD